MWDYSSANRQSLRHKTTPALYLTQGTALHTAIEAAVNKEDPYLAAKDYIYQERERLMQSHEDITGLRPFDMEMEEFDAAGDFVRKLIVQYFNRYDQHAMLVDEGLEYLAAEVSFCIPLPGFDDVFLVGTFDGLAIDENGGIWVVEHKTYGSKPGSEDLQHHSQTNGYALAFFWLTGMELTGTLYDGVSKTLIKAPAVLKNGQLSVNKRQSITLQGLLDSMAYYEIDPFDPRYAEMLNHFGELERQGDSRFFHREKIFFNQVQVASWEQDLLGIVAEMTSSPRIYRTVPYNGCGPQGQGCWYRDLCHTQHTGGDVDLVLTTRYQTGTYGTMEAVADTPPTMIESVDGLKEFLRTL
jgi:hypothetical protein